MPRQSFLLTVALAAASLPFASALAGMRVAHAVMGPTIINVDGGEYPERNHETADREQLLREFPDHLVERMWIQDWQDLERGFEAGRLVDVPSDPVGRGIVLRLEGSSRIGELVEDAYRQSLLCRLTKPAAGLLYRVAARLRLIEGEAYQPLEITSLARTWDYQLRLTDVNPNADRTREGVPPTHVLGLAFDIARTQMSEARQQRIEFLFDQMASDGELAYYKEGSSNGLMHYHVIALPSADGMLVREYDRGVERAERNVDAMQRHHYASLSPCVTFGISLEPYCSICSCELPVEVSAATVVDDAPVSR